MSLILCRQEPVTVPLYIEDLGIHIYSSQELCYVIYNNPLLVLEGFIDKRLTEFLRSELRMPFLAERVEKWMDSHGATEEILYLILKECNYYTPKEQAAYRQTVNGLKNSQRKSTRSAAQIISMVWIFSEKRSRSTSRS